MPSPPRPSQRADVLGGVLALEPLGLERVAAAVRAAGHDVRILDLQVFRPTDNLREVDDFAPDAVGFSLNYLSSVPEVLDLARETRRRPGCFDVQHAVLPTTLPLYRFYEELVHTQAVINHKHLGWAAVRSAGALAIQALLRGQTNYVRMNWKFASVYDADRQCEDHQREVRYALRPRPPLFAAEPRKGELFVHAAPVAAPRPATG